jgi:hypothetical protein
MAIEEGGPVFMPNNFRQWCDVEVVAVTVLSLGYQHKLSMISDNLADLLVQFGSTYRAVSLPVIAQR